MHMQQADSAPAPTTAPTRDVHLYQVLSRGEDRERLTGIYVRGSCDMRSVLRTRDRLERVLNGTCAYYMEGDIAYSRSDVLLQTLRDLPADWTRAVTERLSLSPSYFEPTLFQPTFTVRNENREMTFPKTLIVMSIGADAIRTVYRHRENGLLIDPGGWWLNQQVASALANPETALWFAKEFQSVGKIPVSAFYENYTRIVQAIRAGNPGVRLMVLNVLTVEPGVTTRNYQFVRNSLSKRRRELNVALVELSRKLDFSILDVDRCLKKVGINQQYDFGHFPEVAGPHLTTAVWQIMQEFGIPTAAE